MSNRLGGKQGTAYLGTNANQPPNYTFSDRDPNQYDINNVSLGDLWLNESDQNLWVLVSLAGDSSSRGSLATWSEIESGGATGTVNGLTGNSGGKVDPDGTGNINLVGDGVGITITGNPGTNTLTASLVGGGEAGEVFQTDSGTARPINGVLNIISNAAAVNAGSTVSFSGATNFVTLNVTDTNDNTIIGKDSGSLLITGGDNTILGEESGFALTSGSDNIMIGNGVGVGLTVGSDNILMGSGTGSALTVGDSGNTIIGGSGFAGSNSFVLVAAGSGGTPFLHNYPGSNATTTNGGNTFVGANAGNFSLNGSAGNASNNGIGSGNLSSLTTGANNNSLGSFALNRLTTGTNNVAIGHGAGFNSGANTGITTGTFNVLLGYTAGENYISNESSNIIIGDVPGTVADQNTLRLGAGTGTSSGQINKAFVSGIRGITPATNDGIPVFVNSLGQLGTVGSFGAAVISTVTGNSGGAVSPSAGNINIVGDGTTIQITGNPGTNTLTVVGLGGGGGDLSILTGDTGSATAAAGTIDVIAGTSAQNCGSSVSFHGSGSTLELNVTDANDNTIIGLQSGNATLTGTTNVALGNTAAVALTTGTANVALGSGSGHGLTTGSNNVFVGTDAGETITTGASNIIMGLSAGSAYTSSESSNILFNSAGVVAESHAMRIGTGTGTSTGQLNKSFISGIRGITPTTNDGLPVFINSVGQLGTVGSGGTTLISTITGNSGGAVSPASGNINIVGDGTTIQITGNPGTNTLTVVGLGGGGGDLSILTGDFGSATAMGGTIDVIADTAGVVCGSTVSFSGTGNILSLNVSDTNSNTMIGFDSGVAGITGTDNVALGTACGNELTTGSTNIFIGTEAGSLVTTGSGNLIIGNGTTQIALKGITTSAGFYGLGANGSAFLHNFGGSTSGNTFVGYGAAGNFNTGQQASGRNNTACGLNSLSLITTGINNVALGASTGSITSGASNTLIGVGAGFNYASSESSNICIGSGTNGTVTESNALRIGSGTGTANSQINKTFIAGIRGITTGISNAIPVVIDSNGQLGTAGGASTITTVTGNTGGPVSATGGNVTVRGDGSSITVTGNPGTSTLTISALGGASGPSFFAYLNTTALAVTGGGVVYNVIYDTLPYNLGSAFNLGSSIFTAPTTGLYNFSCGTSFVVHTGNTKDGIASLITSSRTISLSQLNYVNTSFQLYGQNRILTLAGGNVYVNMTAGDTAFISVVVNGGSQNTDVSGVADIPSAPSAVRNFFSGQLV